MVALKLNYEFSSYIPLLVISSRTTDLLAQASAAVPFATTLLALFRNTL